MHIPKYTSNSVKKSPFTKNILLPLRIALGLMLFIKGINFIRNDGILRQLLTEAELIQNLSILKLLIPWIHILGGFFILIGLYTRVAALVQLPFVLGAILILLNAQQYEFYDTELIFAVTILVLLIIGFIYGDGYYSWRNLIQKEKDVL